MKLCNAFFLLSMLCCAVTVAQNDSINRLGKVTIVADSYVRNNVVGQKVTLITGDNIVKNPTNLTETLRFNSVVAIRDYGNGGTSSARFRGTSAANTAVMWNGINVNAIGNGQTGLNSLSLNTADEIVIKSGGGSVKYGSGAIGGSIHANDNLYFHKHQNFQLFSSYGSFNTTSNFLKTNLGTEKWALKLGANFNKSDNDYDLIDERYKDANGNYLKNSNGDYENYGLNLSVGYQFTEGNTLSFYTTGFKGDRLFSGELQNPSAANEKYKDINQRNLLVWEVQKNQFSHVVKTAYLTQEYRYFKNKNSNSFDFGKSKRWLFNYDFKYHFNKKTTINTYVDIQNIEGDVSGVPNKKYREQYAFAFGFNSIINKQWKYNIESKKEFNSAFKVPTVFSLGSNYALNDNNEILLNISTNYRVPTLNDLHWPGQGNEDLIPENSKQIDAGYQYKNDWFTFKSTLFYMHVLDKIIWTPIGDINRPDVWTPINLNESIHKGAEFYASFCYPFSKYHSVDVATNYIYTVAKDTETNKELIFVPRHLFNATVNYQNNIFTAYVQNLSQSKVYTTEDNINTPGAVLNGFTVFNAGTGVSLLKKGTKSLHVILAVKNIFNQLYLYSISRPMPGRNYNLNINYKF
ncbi:iron complex outermembrane recepter protein [Wenyingzhuangia marina]|uniref:Iron complex outermembrane recepter protein n=2 Tax=Wenyingzhuangia marina TaxID=1195760 RepID=A0A1M5WPD2_9FLAO|nr:iron complex outermembrane recepter protein [Wenyingzhuangia marina]